MERKDFRLYEMTFYVFGANIVISVAARSIITAVIEGERICHDRVEDRSHGKIKDSCIKITSVLISHVVQD